MNIIFDETGTLPGLQQALSQIVQYEETQSIMILACDGNGFQKERADPILQALPVPVFGGVFPEILHNQQKYELGSIVVGLTDRPQTHLIENLSRQDRDFSDYLDNLIPHTGLARTMIVLVDGLAERINDLIKGIFDILGLELNIIGGGAGSLSFEQKPCIFTNQGLVADCAQLVLTEMKSGIGVSHGWKRISGPYKVTSSEGNTIKTLDWQPAFDLYRKVVEQASGNQFTEDNFFEIAKAYPFGINKLEEEKIVRDPILLNEKGELVCVGEVPEGSFIDILEGNIASLVAAAQLATERSISSFPGESHNGFQLFIDCISRVLFMQEEFSQELQAVAREGIPLIGALTLGEIANSGRDYLEFYNKTAVIGLLEPIATEKH
ncbi:MAG: FIST N-terminal domain-containing protein [Bacteroidota bacterium]